MYDISYIRMPGITQIRTIDKFDYSNCLATVSRVGKFVHLTHLLPTLGDGDLRT
jgi:hypothetical protein